MQTRYFMAIIEGGDKPGYSVYFPDLPGCASAGNTVEDAARNAEEALSLHLRGMSEDGVEIPVATVPEKIKAEPGSVEVARLLVRGEAPSKSVRLNISLDQALIAKIDRAAKTRSMTRSGFIARAATKALDDAD